eukprot:137947-Rhodomonas_salina.1
MRAGSPGRKQGRDSNACELGIPVLRLRTSAHHRDEEFLSTSCVYGAPRPGSILAPFVLGRVVATQVRSSLRRKFTWLHTDTTGNKGHAAQSSFKLACPCIFAPDQNTRNVVV